MRDPSAEVVNDDPGYAERSFTTAELIGTLADAMHLGSASLPIGGFAYSQGLEQAHDHGLIANREDAAAWIRDALLLVLARQELPYWLACHGCAESDQWEQLIALAQELKALRETAEFRLESAQMGYSLMQVFDQWLPREGAEVLAGDEHRSHPGRCFDGVENINEGLAGRLHESLKSNYTAAHATLAAIRGLSATTGMATYIWSWLESQVMASVKIVPLGQRDGQWLLHQARGWMDEAVRVARVTDIQQAGSAAFGLAVLSARHETQYSRLFRS